MSMNRRPDEGGWTLLQTVTWIRTRNVDLVRRYGPVADGRPKNRPALFQQDAIYPSASDPNFPTQLDDEPDDAFAERTQHYRQQTYTAEREERERAERTEARAELTQTLRQGRLIALDAKGEEIKATRWQVIELHTEEVNDFTFRSADIQRLWQQRAAIGKPKQETVNAWMMVFFQSAKDRGEPKPRRDPAIKECQRTAGAQYRQALTAYDAVPATLKNPRFRPKQETGN